MLSMLKGWEGKVQVNGTIYDNIDAFICENKAISGEIHILLCSGLNIHLNERGVHAGIICWFIDKQVTLFIPIQALEHMKEQGYKSIRYDADPYNMILKPISGKRKRVFFEYDMTSFFEEVIL